MTNTEILEMNIPLVLIGFKIDSLIKSLSSEQKEIYKSSIEDYKKIFLDKLATHLPKDKALELLSMLDID